MLSVGDIKFREKCEKRLNEMMTEGTTVLFVSHSMGQVQKICKNVLWLDKGEMKMFGPSKEVCKAYEKSLNLGNQS